MRPGKGGAVSERDAGNTIKRTTFRGGMKGIESRTAELI